MIHTTNEDFEKIIVKSKLIRELNFGVREGKLNNNIVYILYCIYD